MKTIVFSSIAFLLCLGALEVFSSEFFRYYAALELPFFPRGPAFTYLVKKALKIPTFYPIESVEPRQLYIADQRLAYTTRRGKYKVGFTLDHKALEFNFTVPQQGIRLTSYAARNDGRSIYVFGDSVILG
jgi:hypothetical protein